MWTESEANKNRPMHETPYTDEGDSGWTEVLTNVRGPVLLESRRGGKLSRQSKPKAEGRRPSHTGLFSKREDPMLAKSKADEDDPRQLRPYASRADSAYASARSKRDKSRCMVSGTERIRSGHAIPYAGSKGSACKNV